MQIFSNTYWRNQFQIPHQANIKFKQRVKRTKKKTLIKEKGNQELMKEKRNKLIKQAIHEDVKA